jgi:preprotein translocase SecE subunit
MNIIEKITDYLRSSIAEIKKVSWPTRRDTIRYSSLILGVSVAVGLFFMGLDYGFTKLFDVTVLRLAQDRATQQAADAQRQAQQQAPTVSTTEQAPQTTQPAPVDLNKAKPLVTPDAQK